MNTDFKEALKKLNTDKVISMLPGIRRGFEKECLRVDKTAHIAMTGYPVALGSNLTHPMITTDFSEALLELITPPVATVADLFRTLLELHQYTYASLENEFLWAFSMPSHLPSSEKIPIAHYGHSNLGLLKYYYRVGLGHRYGKRMQMIAGVHYNFSFSEAFWRAWQPVSTTRQSTGDTEQSFISESYLGLIRNALRLNWLFPLLFGASPAISSEFVEQDNISGFQSFKEDTLFLPYATSLRLSDLGYHNKAKPLVEISYNSFPEWIESLHRAVHTRDPEFAKIGVKVQDEYRQLSDSVLQVEDEHYALLRAKRMTGPGERMWPALAKEGVEYIEVRALDLDPFSPLGVEVETVYFLDIFLIFCLLRESPPFSNTERSHIASNQQRVAKAGREPGLTLTIDNQERLLLEMANDILDSMGPIADCLDKAYGGKCYRLALSQIRGRIQDFNLLPSARILAEMQAKQVSYCAFASHWSRLHEQTIKSKDFAKPRMDYYKALAKQSLLEQIEMEQKQTMSFDDYLKKFLQA